MIKKSKSILLLFLLVLSYQTRCLAQGTVQGIIVELTTGEKLEYRLVDNPKIMFDGTTITLTADGVMIEFTPTELKKVTTGEIKDNSNGIDELNYKPGNISVFSGFIRLSGFPAGESIRVFSVKGILLTNYYTSPDGILVIPLSSLPAGISIIKTNNQSIKISKQ